MSELDQGVAVPDPSPPDEANGAEAGGEDVGTQVSAIVMTRRGRRFMVRAIAALGEAQDLETKAAQLRMTITNEARALAPQLVQGLDGLDLVQLIRLLAADAGRG